MSSGAGVKIPVEVGDWETMENLIEDGSASADDWDDWCSANLQGSSWPGFIYKNVSVETAPVEPAVVGSSGSEPTWRTRWEFAGGNPNHGKDGRFSSGPGGAEPALSPEDRKTRDLIAGQIAAERAKKGLKPLSENSLRGYAIKEHQRRNEMMAKVESPKAAEPAKLPIVGGTMDDKRVARRNAAFTAVGGNLHLFGNSLMLEDDSWNPVESSHNSRVSQHLQDLAGLPAHLIKEFIAKKGTVWVGNGNITDLHPALAVLKNQRPRGWPENTDYSMVPGVFYPDGRAVVLGAEKPGSRFRGVTNFSLHEFGHAVDLLRKETSLLSKTPAFTTLHNAFQKVAKAAGKLNDYYVQGGSSAGASEFYADSTRAYFKGLKANVPASERNHVFRTSFSETGTYTSREIADRMIKYLDGIYGEPKATRVRKAA